MAQTVAQVLTSATDSVTIINDINTNGNSSSYAGATIDIDGNEVNSPKTQAEINIVVQRNVDHLETILTYTNPNVVGDSSDKSSYTTAITTGTDYIAAN
tara:strand:+ start:171 stop:467 length:297 start_codon:yes stop_codon:yes gene_type:complete